MTHEEIYQDMVDKNSHEQKVRAAKLTIIKHSIIAFLAIGALGLVLYLCGVK